MMAYKTFKKHDDEEEMNMNNEIGNVIICYLFSEIYPSIVILDFYLCP